MRICHVSPHLPPDQAANALLPAQLGEWGHQAGDDVTFVTQEPTQGRVASDEGWRAGRIWRVPARRPTSGLRRALRIETWKRISAIRAALRQAAAGADLLHLHSNGLIVEVAAAWAGRHRVPFALTLYGTEIWHYRRRWPIDPFTRTYMRAAVVTFYSARLEERAKALGLHRRRLEVVYPAVSPSFIQPAAAERERWRAELGIQEPLVILNVKRLHELAGQRYLIDAFARIARERRDVRLVICGTGPLKADLERRAHLGLVADRITFAGLVANDRVARYAAVADVFALPSLLEALPTVAVEALAAGTPVVSADHPGGQELQEIFGADVTVVPKRNVDALARALSAALAVPRRTHVETAGIVDAHFSPSAVATAYRRVHAACLARGARRS